MPRLKPPSPAPFRTLWRGAKKLWRVAVPPCKAARGQVKIFASPFIYTDEGLSFGGACDGFDVSGFTNPLRDAECEVQPRTRGGVQKLGRGLFWPTITVRACRDAEPSCTRWGEPAVD